MAITKEQAEKLKHEVAVVCCRKEAGKVITEEDLEDPTIFPDLVDSGLLELPEDTLKIGQVIGGTLKETVDSLTPLTPANIEGYSELEDAGEAKEERLSQPKEKAVLKNNLKKGDVIKASDLENPKNFAKLESSNLIELTDDVLTREEAVGKKVERDVPALTAVVADFIEGMTPRRKQGPVAGPATNYGSVRIKIDEGKGIDIEVPIVGGSIQEGVHEVPESFGPVAETVEEPKEEDKVIRSLIKKHFEIEEVKLGDETKIDGKTLYIRKGIEEDAKKVDDLIVDVKMDIITPDKYDTYSETIMDVQPIATKEEGHELGSGITRVIDGVVMMVTGTDANGVQIGEFGSSEGILEENIMWGRPGAPDKGEIFIKTDVTIKEGTNMERPGPLAAHKATDFITQEIRNELKELDESLVVKEEEFKQTRRPGKKKVVIVKEIMGQGAMHDNLILPIEPVGILGAKPNVDLGNVPVVCSPLEILDGAVHALTCIGPASKECSRHYWREPLVMEALEDESIDLCGVILVGSPQINAEKFYVSKRVGMTVEAMDVDGAFVTTEGFGNNHIDFASHIEQIGMRNIPVVGMSFCAVQGALVIGNEYMRYMVDHNKSEDGIENEILSCNTLTEEDAVRAIEMLKAVMDGEEVAEPERQWEAEVKENNLKIIEEEKGIEIERVPNETSIPMNEKRRAAAEEAKED